jgi:hypothetical protein
VDSKFATNPDSDPSYWITVRVRILLFSSVVYKMPIKRKKIRNQKIRKVFLIFLLIDGRIRIRSRIRIYTNNYGSGFRRIKKIYGSGTLVCLIPSLHQVGSIGNHVLLLKLNVTARYLQMQMNINTKCTA